MGYKFTKRIFDLFASFFGIIILLPLFMIVSLLIVSTSKGGIFYKQERIGKDGKEFKILKFRSMVKNADKKGMQITVDKDNRITKIGKFIRKTKIDELPQLFNVFIGQMSFVGPRPEVAKYVAMYNKNKESIVSKPGITDLMSIEYRDYNEMLKWMKILKNT